MKIKNLNNLPLMVTTVLTILAFPILWLCIRTSYTLFYETLASSMKMAGVLLCTFVFISSAIWNGICRCVLLLEHPFWGAVIVCGFFLNIAIALFLDVFDQVFISILVSVFFFFLAFLLDKPLRSLLKRWRENRCTFVTTFFYVGTLLLLWVIGFLLQFVFSDLGSNGNWIVGVIVVMGYAAILGRVYDITVSYSPKPWLTRMISMMLMLGGSLTAILLSTDLYNTLFATTRCATAFWTAVGILLYDLGCYVAGRMGKRLASKKQDLPEETAEA